jgi:hypothetical protein
LQIFIGAARFSDIGGASILASAGPGLLSRNLAAAAAGSLFTDVAELLKRTGVYATPGYDQSQFGTGSLQPGPSAVAGTSGPEGIFGMPPYTSAQLPTLVTPTAGPVAKGVQINSVDVIYNVTTTALAVATIGLTKTKFTDNAVRVVTSLVPLGANGLPTANRGNDYVKNIPVANPVMLTDADSEVILNINLTAGAGGTAIFYGAVLNCSFNLN